MTVLEDLQVYLGAAASQWTEAELVDAISAETRAQLRVVIEPAIVVDGVSTPIPVDDWPEFEYDDLYEALLRRCARNLAMRKLPLGITTVAESEALRIGSVDPEIRRFEWPHLQQVLG